MDAERWQKARTLFLAALELDDDARTSFLDGACGEDRALFDEIQGMLGGHGESRALALERRVVVATELATGTRIGAHRVVAPIGRGGMGDVYLAERDDDLYRQRVAIKVVRAGWGGGELALRFERERQILARLSHPHIAQLLDGGVMADGRPFLVMQYVEGVPITEYCDTHGLSVAARLELFGQVLDAVQFAHLNLVVHRDLKPGNILVTDDGNVKLLDFGIAKLLDPEGPREVAVTRTEVRVMTPDYAAPEQFRGAAITTVTDVYALGVLLYELLTGQRPYVLAERTPLEAERVVCEMAPRRPSTVEVDATAGASRGTTPRRLARRLRGDLDKIVMMALRKEPERRYGSVAALGEDVRRHLDDLPVRARADRLGYRLGKLLRRRRWAVMTTVVVALLIVGFAVAMTVQATRIARNAKALEAERDRVRLQVEKTTRVKTLVSDLFKVLDPDETEGTPGDRLEAASARIVDDLADQPDLQAELMDEVLTIYFNLGLYDAALDMARASLAVRETIYADADPELAWGVRRVGEALYVNSRFDEARVAYERALTLQRAALGDDDVELGRTLAQLGRLVRNGNELELADRYATEAVEILRATLGVDHADTVDALYQLAVIRARHHSHEVAEPLMREVLAVRRRTLAADDPLLAWTQVTTARFSSVLGRLDEAESLLLEALDIYRQRFVADHPDTSRAHLQLGRIHAARQEWTRAADLYRQAFESRRSSLGDEHSATLSAQLELAGALVALARYDEAETLVLDALPRRRRAYGMKHRFVRDDFETLVSLYDAWGKLAEADAARAELEALP
ncbi:MAG: tetratricopeptide repeat protein [Acidobacteriota bacterium]